MKYLTNCVIVSVIVTSCVDPKGRGATRYVYISKLNHT